MEIGGMNNQPVQSVLEHGGSELRGEYAQISNIMGAISLSDMVKSTLGPKGMDKILIKAGPNNTTTIEVTNDGATILRHVNPQDLGGSAKILQDISKTQDEEVGDGTTSVCVFTGELLRQAEKLLRQNIHPQTIIDGYLTASDIARKTLLDSAINHSDDKEKFQKDLLNIARTTISSKVLNQEKEYFAKLSVDAVLRLKGSTNLDQIQIIKKAGGNLRDSYLDEGFILEKSFGIGMKKRLENPKILLANTAMDTDKIKIYGAKVRTGSMKTLSEIEKAEKQKMKNKCQKIIDHKADLFINRQLIYDYPLEVLADAGMSAIEHADFDGIERLALVLGGDIISTFENPSGTKLGQCELVEEIMIGEDRLLKFSGCARNEACTIVLRGASKHLLEEAERSLHDALCVLTQTVNSQRTVLGGGCSEMRMAKAIQDEAKVTSGKKAIAMKAYAEALKQIPTIISANAGYDSAELVQELEKAHYEGKDTAGLDMDKGVIGDLQELGITESYQVKSKVVITASEASTLLLRINSIIRNAPRQRQGH